MTTNSRIWFLALVLVGCTTHTPTKQAVGFEVTQTPDTTTVVVYSPWRAGTIMAQYAFDSPYHRIACTSATHIGFLRELGLMDRVVGVCHPERIYNLTPAQRAAIHDLGDDLNPNLEAILLSEPDAIVISTYAEGDESAAKVASLGIPVLYCNEWTETTPLARAEWIRFFGACFGCMERADSILQVVTKAYTALCATQTSTVSILSGQAFRGTWYVPTGNTYMGQLFHDAGADYYYQDNPSSASLPLTTEMAIKTFAEADVWVGCSARSLRELAAMDNKHTWLKAYQTGNVYNFYKRSVAETGANDFWETGVVHPERILQDLRYILTATGSDCIPASDSLYFSARLN